MTGNLLACIIATAGAASFDRLDASRIDDPGQRHSVAFFNASGQCREQTIVQLLTKCLPAPGILDIIISHFGQQVPFHNDMVETGFLPFIPSHHQRRQHIVCRLFPLIFMQYYLLGRVLSNPAEAFRLVALVVVVLLAAGSIGSAQAAGDSSRTEATTPDAKADTVMPATHILAVGHFNGDSRPDTLFGGFDSHMNIRPAFIAWGDSSKKGGERKERTEFRYPKWISLTGSSAIQRINRDDGLDDICFYLRGECRTQDVRQDATDRDADGADGRSTSLRDTMRAVVIFGQKDLDKVRVIHIDHIAGFQTRPFFALDLWNQEKLVEPKGRDLSGRKSYELAEILLEDGRARRESEEQPGMLQPVASMAAVETGAVIAPDYHVSIYPNPVPRTASLQASTLPEGEYQVDVISVGGSIVHQQHVSVGTDGGLLRLLDLDELPGGYYLVRIASQNIVVGSYPIIITR